MPDLRRSARRKAHTFVTISRQDGLAKAFATGVSSAKSSALYWSARSLGRSSHGTPLTRPDPTHARIARSDDLSVRVAAVRLSVVLCVGDVIPSAVRASFESVLRQTHAAWELCACATNTRQETLEELGRYRGSDPRIRILPEGSACDSAQATDLAAQQASGVFLVLLDAGDELHPGALEAYATAAVDEHPSADVLYADEERITASGELHAFVHKPDWSPSYLESAMYVGHGIAVRKSVFWQLGGMRSQFAGAEAYDLLLRCARRRSVVGHVPEVLYRRAATPGDDQTERMAAAAAVRDYAAGLEGAAYVEDGLVPETFRVRRPSDGCPVTLVILTADPTVSLHGRDGVPMLANMLDSLSGTLPPGARVLVVDDGSLCQASIDALARLGGERAGFIDPLRPALGFSFARKANFAVGRAETDYVILLNDDLEARGPGWVEALLEPLQDPDVGLTGARLLYPDNTVQHVGIILGVDGGSAHAFRGMPAATVAPGSSTHVIREYSAVTGAVMAFNRRTFDRLGGLDEVFAHDYQDVDFCARVLAAGLRVVYTPYSELVHFEGKTFARGSGFQEEEALFRRRWPGLIRHDPSYNPHGSRSSLPGDK